MVLLRALGEAGFRRMIVCHLDHQLRGKASRADAALVRRTAAKLGLPFESAKCRTQDYAAAEGKSVELAARELRRAFFQACATKHRCRRLILAHHADDQVETCLFNFLRGTGSAGLAGMRPVSKQGGLTIVRPLLDVSRSDIAAFAQARRVAFREDASNADLAHTRNRLRQQVLPAIEKAFGPAFRPAILRAAEILRGEEDFLASQVPDVGTQLTCAGLRRLPIAIQRRTVLAWLRRSGIVDPGFFETRLVLGLLDVADGPAKVNLPGGQYARRRAGVIFIEKGSL